MEPDAGICAWPATPVFSWRVNASVVAPPLLVHETPVTPVAVPRRFTPLADSAEFAKALVVPAPGLVQMMPLDAAPPGPSMPLWVLNPRAILVGHTGGGGGGQC